MNTELVSYEVNSKTFEGLHVKPEVKNAPCVLIAHTWAGRDGFVEGIANKLAEDGYNAFAIDMYGDGKVGGSSPITIKLSHRSAISIKAPCRLVVAKHKSLRPGTDSSGN